MQIMDSSTYCTRLHAVFKSGHAAYSTYGGPRSGMVIGHVLVTWGADRAEPLYRQDTSVTGTIVQRCTMRMCFEDEKIHVRAHMLPAIAWKLTIWQPIAN